SATCKKACKPPMPFRKPRSDARLRERCAFLTGKERDNESSNDYFGARYYWNGAGRWLSVDSGKADVADPQMLNRYRYCRNDPVNLVDPDGRLEGPPPSTYSYWLVFYWGGRGNVAPPPPPPQTQPGSGWEPPNTNISELVKLWLSFYPGLSSEQLANLGPAQNDAINKLLQPGKCRDFMTNLLGLTGIISSDGAALTADDLAGIVSETYFYDGTRSQLPDGDGTIATLFASDPNIIAAAGGNRVNPYSKPIPGYVVFLNSSFWNQAVGQQASTLIHEGAHNVWTGVLTDQALAKLLTGQDYATRKEASQALSKEIDNACGN
ncbi:MAG: RHS repeat-associated core domain-containing protein, partial [Acidobacteriota bacterium]